MLEPYLAKWNLVPDGVRITTHSSDLLPVLFDGKQAMLKVARTAEEERGNRLMVSWAKRGAAKVLAHEGPAIVIERATGGRSLAELAKNGDDAEATTILCEVAGRLHRNTDVAPDLLCPLDEWFSELRSRAAEYGGWLSKAASTAEDLLARQRDLAVLHGDLHHRNVLDFGGEWRAIDPKGLYGERAFEFANLLRNPDQETAEAPGRLVRQADLISARTGIDRQRLLLWAFAFAGLSAAWLLGDGEEPREDKVMAKIIGAELGLS